MFSHTKWIRKQSSFWFPSSSRKIKNSIKQNKMLKDKGPCADAVPAPALLFMSCSWGHLSLHRGISALTYFWELELGSGKIRSKKIQRPLSLPVCLLYFSTWFTLQPCQLPYCKLPGLQDIPIWWCLWNHLISLPTHQYSLSNAQASHRSPVTWLLIKETFIHTLPLYLCLHYLTTEVTPPLVISVNVLL